MVKASVVIIIMMMFNSGHKLEKIGQNFNIPRKCCSESVKLKNYDLNHFIIKNVEMTGREFSFSCLRQKIGLYVCNTRNTEHVKSLIFMKNTHEDLKLTN